MARSKIISAANVVCFINNQVYGKVTGFSYSSSTPKKRQMGIDSLRPYELIPTGTVVQGQLALLRLVGDAGIEGAGMTAPFADLSKEKYFSIALVDRTSDTVIFQADYASISSESWSIPSKGIVTGTVTFEALDWTNEIKKIQP